MEPNIATLKRVVEQIHDLPTLPSVVTKLLSLVQNPLSSANDLEQILSRDPSLMVKVLRIANSPFYGSKDITTLEHAIVVLGFSAIRSIALSASVFESFPGTGRPGFDRRDFWRHSLGVATAARQLALKMGWAEIEEAFIAGLIHDVGKVILDEYASESWQQALTYAQQNNTFIIEAERTVLGVSHAQVGRWLAAKWKLPQNYTSAIFYHHHPAFASRHEDLAAIIHIADIMARSHHMGSSGDSLVPQFDPSSWKLCRMEEAAYQTTFDELPEEFTKVCASFEPSPRS
ncbi:MAG: HDOD domain-containing protein [Verrucomicrobiae bacterium]|nr:HDOD domain-containing protein [Verrucomicrobiae bacterium]